MCYLERRSFPRANTWLACISTWWQRLPHQLAVSLAVEWGNVRLFLTSFKPFVLCLNAFVHAGHAHQANGTSTRDAAPSHDVPAHAMIPLGNQFNLTTTIFIKSGVQQTMRLGTEGRWGHLSSEGSRLKLFHLDFIKHAVVLMSSNLYCTSWEFELWSEVRRIFYRR